MESSRDLKSFALNEELSDVIIGVEDSMFYAHKVEETCWSQAKEILTKQSNSRY